MNMTVKDNSNSPFGWSGSQEIGRSPVKLAKKKAFVEARTTNISPSHQYINSGSGSLSKDGSRRSYLPKLPINAPELPRALEHSSGTSGNILVQTDYKDAAWMTVGPSSFSKLKGFHSTASKKQGSGSPPV